MDEKGARVYMLAGEEVVVLIGVLEMYVGILENRLLVTVVKCISANRRSILPLIIVKRVMIIAA